MSVFYLQEFVKVFQSAGDLMKVHFRHPSNLDNKHQPPWWDSACDEAELKKYRLLRKFRTTHFPDDFASYKSQRNCFKGDAN